MDIHKNFPRVSECCRCVWQLLYQGWLWHLTPPHTQRLAEYGCDIKRRFFLRFVQHGQMVFSLERIAFRMMVVRFRIVLNTSTPTITFHTTMSIPKVRIPLCNQSFTPPLRLQPILGVWSSLRDLSLWVRRMPLPAVPWWGRRSAMQLPVRGWTRIPMGNHLRRKVSHRCHRSEFWKHHRQVPLLAGRTSLRLAHWLYWQLYQHPGRVRVSVVAGANDIKPIYLS